MTNDPKIYLITPPLADAGVFAPRLTEALDAVPVACLLVRLASADEAVAKRIVRALSPIAEAHDTALLVADDPRLAARAGADGVHLSGPKALAEAVASLKPERIVGCAGLASRDDAMSAGEADIDYVMFGEAPGARPADTLERTEWWAEIFNVPCVAVARTLDDVEDLARAGADFIALGACAWDDPRGVATALRAAAAAMGLRALS